MKYAHLKQERDDAIARALEAERLSMKSEFDRVTEEHAEQIRQLNAAHCREVFNLYNRIAMLRSALSTARAAANSGLENDAKPPTRAEETQTQ